MHGRLAQIPSPTGTETGMSAPTSWKRAWTRPLIVSPMPCTGGALEITYFVGGVTNIPFDRGETVRVEIDAALGGELGQRKSSDHCGVEQEHTRIAVLADDPRVNAARVYAALACDAIAQPQRFECRARAHDRDREISPPAGEVLGHDVEWIRDNEGDAGKLAGFDVSRDRLHDREVLVQHVQAALAGGRVMTRGDDENVFALDLVEAAPAYLDV